MRSGAVAFLVLLALGACGSRKPAPGDAAASPLAGEDAAAPADAAPPRAAARAITADEKRRYRAALRRGRALAKQGDHAAAIAAFDEALAAVPDDARALSELGWAAFRAGELARAREATERSIGAAGDPSLRAASIYNLGRIHEAEGRAGQAIEEYRRSLALRPHAIVRDRLLSLDPAARPDELVAPAPLDGPHASLAAFCAAHAEAEPGAPCDPASALTPQLPPVALAPPYRELALLITGFDETCSLALRTAEGWFVHEGFTECKLMGGRWDRDVTFPAAALRDVVPGGAPALVVEILSEETFNDTPADAADDDMELISTTSRTLMVCGLGRSGRPSCTQPVLLAWSGDRRPAVAFTATFEAGALVLRLAQGGTAATPELAGRLGRHPLRFP
jgi:hypothetical protein